MPARFNAWSGKFARTFHIFIWAAILTLEDRAAAAVSAAMKPRHRNALPWRVVANTGRVAGPGASGVDGGAHRLWSRFVNLLVMFALLLVPTGVSWSEPGIAPAARMGYLVPRRGPKPYRARQF